MRKPTLGLVLLLIAAWGGRAAAEPPPPDDAQAMALVAEAASASPAYLRTLAALGAKLDPQDLQAHGADVPLTAAAVVLGPRGLLDRQDFLLYQRNQPERFAEALHPRDVRAGRLVPRHAYASLVHPEYVTGLVMSHAAGEVSGTLLFRAPEVYEGTVAFRAVPAEDGWRVVELSFPHSGVRTTWDDGRWRLRVESGKRAPAAAAGADLDLPVVGTVGHLPPAAAAVAIEVTREGWVHADGGRDALSLRALQQHLAARMTDRTLREPDGNSKLTAVLRLDASIPWTVTQWLMQTCAHPDARIHRIALAARTPAGDEGCLLMGLPTDSSGPSGPPVFPTDFAKHKLKVFKTEDTAGPSDMRALHARILRRRADLARALPEAFEIVAPPPKGGAVPHGYVLQLLDVCLAAGAKRVLFEGAAMPRGDGPDPSTSAQALKDLIDRVRASPGVPRVRYNNDDGFLADTGGDLPAVPAHGLVQGTWGAAPDVAGDILLEGEVEEDLPDNGQVGPGGGAGGAFRGRGGSRDLQGGEKTYAEAAAAAVDDGLRWLAAHQAPNGGWPAHEFAQFCDGKPVLHEADKADGQGRALYDVGVTGLALQAFLANGYTNRGRHPYAKVVSRGLRYLKNVQDPEGCFGPRSTQAYLYNHAMAGIAMVEAYGMTGSPIFKGSAQRALDFTALARNPYFGWRYGIKPGDNDTSMTCWMGLMLYGARRINADALAHEKPAPLVIDGSAFDGMRAWVAKATDPETGRVGYAQRGTGPARPQDVLQAFPGKESESMTAAAATLRLLLGDDPAKMPDLRLGLDLVLALPPLWSGGRLDMYYWQWGSLAMFQAGGAAWERWRQALVGSVVLTQRKDGETCVARGSWDPRGPWGKDGGRVYATAMMVLTLSAHYRYDRGR